MPFHVAVEIVLWRSDADFVDAALLMRPKAH